MRLFGSPGYHLRERDNILSSLKGFVSFQASSKWCFGLAYSQLVLNKLWGWAEGVCNIGVFSEQMLCRDTEEMVSLKKQ